MLDATFKTLLLSLMTYNLCAEIEYHVVWEYIDYIMYKEEASYCEAETTNLARVKSIFLKGAQLQLEDFKKGEVSDLFCWRTGTLILV